MSLDAQIQGRIHNPKVGGSIPPPATDVFNELRRVTGRLYGSHVNSICPGLPRWYLNVISCLILSRWCCLPHFSERKSCTRCSH